MSTPEPGLGPSAAQDAEDDKNRQLSSPSQLDAGGTRRLHRLGAALGKGGRQVARAAGKVVRVMGGVVASVRSSRVFNSPRLARGLRLALRLFTDGVTLAIAAYALITLNKFFYFNESGYDEGFFVWGGWSIRHGLTPYRDFTELKPPMLFLTHAASQVFGDKDFGFRLFFALFPLAAVLALQVALLARRINRWLALATVLGFTSLFVNRAWHDNALSDSESIGVCYYLLGLAFLLWERRGRRAAAFLGGAMFTCAVLSKEPFAAIVVPTWLGLFWLPAGPEPWRPRARRLAQYSLLGVAAVVVALLIYMVPTGALTAYLRMARQYVGIHRDPKTSICVFIGNAESRELKDVVEIVSRVFVNENTLGYLFPILIPGMVVVARRSKLLFLVVLAAFAGGLYATTASNCPWRHYYIMAMPGVLFALVVSVDSVTQALETSRSSLGTGFGVAALLVVALHMRPDIQTARAETYERKPWEEPVPGVLDVIEKRTMKWDRIFTTGSPMLYVQAHRLSAIRESSIGDERLPTYPGKTDEEKLRPIRDELVQHKPKVIVLDPQYEDRRPRHVKALIQPFLDEFKYQKVKDRIYVRP